MTPREQAAWWVTELQQESPGARARLAEWLKESPRHVEEFLFFDAMWRELGGIDPQRCVDIDRLIEEAKTAHSASNVVPLSVACGTAVEATTSNHAAAADDVARQVRKGVAGGPQVRRWRLVAAVVMLGLTTALGWHWGAPLLTGARTYATAVGEQRAVKLADGSFVYLNTDTRVAVDYSARSRDIKLIEGEALFSVHRDASRPFRVHAGNAVVQAIGTQFNVYRRAQSTTVLVVEGVVQISEPAEPTVPLSLAPLRIEAGEQAEVASSGAVVKHAAADVDKAVAWRARRLVFRSETLENVAGEFNRYNDVKVRVEGSVRSRRLIGTFNADDPESLVQFLTGDEEILIERERDVFVIRAKD